MSGIDFNIYRNGTKITVPLWYELIMKVLNSDQHANKLVMLTLECHDWSNTNCKAVERPKKSSSVFYQLPLIEKLFGFLQALILFLLDFFFLLLLLLDFNIYFF